MTQLQQLLNRLGLYASHLINYEEVLELSWHRLEVSISSLATCRTALKPALWHLVRYQHKTLKMGLSISMFQLQSRGCYLHQQICNYLGNRLCAFGSLGFGLENLQRMLNWHSYEDTQHTQRRSLKEIQNVSRFLWGPIHRDQQLFMPALA